MSGAQDLLLGNFSTAVAGYQIQRSLRFNSADSAYLNRTPASVGNRKTWTWSGWVKRGVIGGTTRYNIFSESSGPTDTTAFELQFGNGGGSGNPDGIRIVGYFTIFLATSAVYRDPSSWYHIVVAFDSTQATAANRLKLYVNGVEVTAFSTDNRSSITQNGDFGVNQAALHTIGRVGYSASFYYDGYITEVNFIDGQALTPSSFGLNDPETGIWSPKQYTGTYGTNGFYLNFSDNSGTTSTTLGKDSSGNGNNWTPNNFSVTAGAGNDSLVDTPTQYGTDTGAGGEVRGNYATWNPNRSFTSNTTLSNGNLNALLTGASNAHNAYGTLGISSGKWYWEITVDATASTYYPGIGVDTNLGLTNSTVQSGDLATGFIYLINGQKYNNATLTNYGASYTANDVIGVALDMDAGTLTFYKNNSSQGQAFSGITGTAVPVVTGYNNAQATANFGQRPFAYTAPSGFEALCTTNLPTPTIGATSTTQANDYFNAVLYTGTGSSQSITGIGFQPDFVWIKGRSGATDHGLYDAVRGVQKQLESNTTTDETTESTGLTAFGSDGFTVGALAQLNTSTATYVAWNWKESTTSSFDIVTYTGNGSARTISHGLGVVPNMIIVKARTTASTDQGWPVYHSANTAAPETDYLLLNSTAATADLDTVWNDTAPTSSVFSVGTNANVNANNDTYVAYLFAAVAGYSAFGSYTGNGSTDGPFIYTGFRPRFVMIKRIDTAGGNWIVLDSARDTYNVEKNILYPNLSNAEGVADYIDFLSNGFKLRTTDGNGNANNLGFIYAAFAEVPAKYSLAR